MVEQREYRMKQDLLETHAPGIWPEMPEHLHHPERGGHPIVRMHPAEQIYRDRAFAFAIRVKNDDVIGALLRYEIEQMGVAVAVRIDEARARAGFDVLLHNVLEVGRFAGARLADHDHVAAVASIKNQRIP